MVISEINIKLKPNGITGKTMKSIEDVTDPTLNSINEKCARIRGAFLGLMTSSPENTISMVLEENQKEFPCPEHWYNGMEFASIKKTIGTMTIGTKIVSSSTEEYFHKACEDFFVILLYYDTNLSVYL